MSCELRDRNLLALAGILTMLIAFAAPGLQAQNVRTGQAVAYDIDLAAALRLARAQNLDVQIARERLNEAKANHGQAMARFLPWISAGVGFRRHEGRTQAVGGELLDVDKQSIAIGPTVTAQVDIGDALFATLAARQLLDASNAAVTVQQQDSTLNAATGYFDLARAKALVEVARDALQTSASYEQQVRAAVAAGVAFKGDELRVLTQTERYRIALAQAQQQQRAAAARLAELLYLDPAVELVPRDEELLPLALMKTDASLDALIEQALQSRAELQRSRALAEAAREDKNNAVYGPLIPSLGAQAFLGEFGGGRGGADGDFASSRDYYVGLNWRLGPGGLFDLTRIHASKSRLSTAELNVEKVSFGIKRQVVESRARVQAASEQMTASRSSLAAAAETLRLTRERKQLGVGIVLEDIQAQQELVRARTDYLSAITEFNKAQYELSKSLGEL
jgi:outer membrane protein TolC